MTGTGFNNDFHSYTFTLPTGQGYSGVKVTTCLSANQGETYVYMQEKDNSINTIFSDFEQNCGCSLRSGIVDNSGQITAGTEYTIELWQYFDGNYAMMVECSTGLVTAGSTNCTGKNVIPPGQSTSSTTSTDSPLPDFNDTII